MTTQTLKTKILPILKRQGVVKAGVFGSFVRNEAKKNSDVDILVEFDKKEKIGLLGFVGLQFELEKKLNRKVDLLTYNSLHHLLKDIILKEQKVIYEKRS